MRVNVIGFEEINILGQVGLPCYFNAVFTNKLDYEMKYRVDFYKDVDGDAHSPHDGRVILITEQEQLNNLSLQLSENSVQPTVNPDELFTVLEDGIVLLELKALQSCSLVLKYLDLQYKEGEARENRQIYIVKLTKLVDQHDLGFAFRVNVA